MKKLFVATFLFAALSQLSSAMAATYEGIAKPWQLGFQEAATPVMEGLTTMHDILLYIITAIVVLVLAAIIYICVRFSKKNNPVPSKTTHNAKLEVIWTVVPILILVGIAIPSLRLHYQMQGHPTPELTVKVVGYQWYWGYEYPDNGGINFESRIVEDKDLKPGQHRLLEVDNRMVVPVDTTVRLQLTGADVIHAFAVPAFGIKKDAMPGRLNETWFKATKTGTFYGQCSELCGIKHGFMPIAIDVVSKDDFAKWVKKQQTASK